MSKLLIPFAPSISTARTILVGEDSATAICRVAACRDRDRFSPTRTLIAGDRLLSVPVVGGASRLKRLSSSLDEIMISDHGAWRREHLGAWNAAYGKAPFFLYIFPMLEKAYAEHSHGSLAEFNDALWQIVTDFLQIDEIMPSLKQLAGTNPDRLAGLREDLTTKVNLNYSIFDAIFRLGKNTIFLLG